MEITAHFVVEQCEPISNPERGNTSGFDDPIDIDSFDNALCNMHSSTGFKAIIALEKSLSLEQIHQLLRLDDFFTNSHAQIMSLL